MKHLFLGLTAILFITSAANATSLHPDTFRKFRLSVTESPLQRVDFPSDKKTQRIEVQANGDVELTIFKDGKKEIGPIVVKTLPTETMEKIEALIVTASKGETKHWTGMVCLAISTRTRLVSADNGNVFIRSGAFPCGAPTYNDTPAAMELANLGTTLLREAVSAIN